MKTKKLLLVLALGGFIAIGAKVLVPDGKPGFTGSPGEETCASCHNPAVGGSITLTSNITNWKYVAGQSYHITVTVSEASRTLFGLGVEVLKNSDNSNAGTLVITNAAETQLLPAESGSGRINVVHKLHGGLVTTAGSKAFTFDWVAPTADSGAVTFYVAGLAAIENGDPTDDNCYTTTRLVNSPSTNVGINEIASAVHFSVFPNPVKDILNISIDNAGSSMVKASLFSITGQKLTDLFCENMTPGLVKKHLNIAGKCNPGAYFIQVEQNGKSYFQKIMIQ